MSLLRRMGIKEYHGLGGVTTFYSFLLYQMIPYQYSLPLQSVHGVVCSVSFSTLRLGNRRANAAHSLLFLPV